MTAVVYDAGALIAGDRGDKDLWTRHLALLSRGHRPMTPAPVVAQVSRSPRQAKLRRLLKGCETVPFTAIDMHAAGALLAAAGTSDVVDAHVALIALRRSATVVTSDPEDIRALLAAVDDPPPVVPV